MKINNGQEQAFPEDAPESLQLEKAFSFKPDGDIEVSSWLERQVLKFVPAARSLKANSRAFKNVCVNWYRKREKSQRAWKLSHIPRGNLVSVEVAYNKALVQGGFRASL